MLTFNLVGTYKGESVLCMRSIDDKVAQSVSVLKGRPNTIHFVSNGDTMSYTQTLNVPGDVNEEISIRDMKVDNTVWSKHGPLLNVIDSRLRFLRFSQRDSILFAAINEKQSSRALVEVQLKPNKFVFRTYSEMQFCHPVAADAREKYIWVVTDTNDMEVHNAWDKEFRRLSAPEGYEFKTVVIINDDGRTAVTVMEHVTKHHVSIAHLVLTDSELQISNIQIVGAPNMQMQPGSLVQGKGCVALTLKNMDQEQQLVTVANHNNSLFCATHNIRISLHDTFSLQRVLFTDILIDNYELALGLVVNRNMYSCWKFNMKTSQLSTSKLLFFPPEMQDMIIERVILMKARQDELEGDLDANRSVLVSAHVTDMITARMRQQLDVAASTARATVTTNRGTDRDDMTVRQIKEVVALRESNDVALKRLVNDHAGTLKRLNAEHAAKVLHLEEIIGTLRAERDQRITPKQHDALKAAAAKDKQALRAVEQNLAEQQTKYSRLESKLDTDLKQWQTRLATMQGERDVARRDLDFFQAKQEAKKDKADNVWLQKEQGWLQKEQGWLQKEQGWLKKEQGWVQKEQKLTGELAKLKQEHQLVADKLQLATEKLELEHQKHDDDQASWKSQNDRLVAENAALQETLSARAQEHDSEKLLMGAQLAELRAHVNDTDLAKKLQQLTMQSESQQNRTRQQFKSMHREIDCLRRANLALSQSYHMLMSVTQFGFLPDGTSLETGVQLMRNLTVLHQDLAVAREDACVLRQKVEELEGKKIVA